MNEAANTNESPSSAHEEVSLAMDDIRNRILHTLEIFPYVSRSMIQVALGPALSPKFWDSPLAALVDEGKVKVVETVVASPGGRALNKSIYHLPCYPYPPVKVTEVEAAAAQ